MLSSKRDTKRSARDLRYMLTLFLSHVVCILLHSVIRNECMDGCKVRAGHSKTEPHWLTDEPDCRAECDCVVSCEMMNRWDTPARWLDNYEEEVGEGEVGEVAEGKWGDIMDCLSEGCEQKLEGCYADETCETIFDATASEREPTDAELSESAELKQLFSCYLSECKGKDSEGLAIKVDSFFGSNGNGNNKDKVDCYEECAGATGYDDDFPSSGK